MKKIITSALTLLTAASLYAAPQAVVFDFGGVMCGTDLDVKEIEKEKLVSFIKTSLNLNDEEYTKKKLECDQACREETFPSDFWQSYAKEKNIVLPDDWSVIFKEKLKDSLTINDEFYALVDELKDQGLTVGMLSNIGTGSAFVLRTLGLYEPFNPLLLSCELGIKKPNPEIYQVLVAELDCPAGDIIFIDDKPENIEAAKAVGIEAILYQSNEQVIKELETRKVLELSSNQ